MFTPSSLIGNNYSAAQNYLVTYARRSHLDRPREGRQIIN